MVQQWDWLILYKKLLNLAIISHIMSRLNVLPLIYNACFVPSKKYRYWFWNLWRQYVWGRRPLAESLGRLANPKLQSERCLFMPVPLAHLPVTKSGRRLWDENDSTRSVWDINFVPKVYCVLPGVEKGMQSWKFGASRKLPTGQTEMNFSLK